MFGMCYSHLYEKQQCPYRAYMHSQQYMKPIHSEKKWIPWKKNLSLERAKQRSGRKPLMSPAQVWVGSGLQKNITMRHLA